MGSDSVTARAQDRNFLNLFCNMKYKLLVISLLCLALGSASLQASTLYWSGNGIALGGAGTWDTTNPRWGTSTSGPFTTVWNNANSDNATLYYNIGGGSVVIGAAITMNGTFTFDQTTGTDRKSTRLNSSHLGI